MDWQVTERVIDVWLFGAKNICAYVGESWKSISYLVSREGLPAYKPKKTWKARQADLCAWLEAERRRHLKE